MAGAVFLPAAELACGSAESMDHLMGVWTAGFTALHPEAPARVTQRAKFSADLTEPLARGELQVAPYARELFPAEQARFAELAGGAARLIPVATGSRATKGGTHAIAIFVNEKNPLAQISLAQLREIFGRDGRLTTWGQLGLTGGWAARKITVHGMRMRRETGNPPGIVNFLEARLLGGPAWRADLRQYTDAPGGAQSLEQITRAVAADEGAIGYSGFGYAVPGVKTLALGETDAGPFFRGTAEEIARREYPLARTIYLGLGPAPEAATREFVRHVFSPGGQAAIAADAQGFFPLPEPERAAAQAMLKADPAAPAFEPQPVAVPAGASYLTPDGAVAVIGYNDMEQMLEALGARFTALHPGVRFAFTLKGTRTAPPALKRGESAFAPMGAEFSPTELADYRAATGGDPREFRVAHCSLDPNALSGPLAIIVPGDSPITSLTMAEV
ncbi:MAG: Phosphate transport system substrate-binding protein, partial [Lacunisphaera sp.]|nr:Phosphate transport system substrate-binding protein [Lacunisphaera sp.]